MQLLAFHREEAGYSLIETSVALVLLVAVLIPLGAFVIGIVSQPLARKTIIAQQLAQQIMEESLAEKRYAPLDSMTLEGKWQILQTVKSEGELVVIRVRVKPHNKTMPRAQFTTIRKKRSLYPN